MGMQLFHLSFLPLIPNTARPRHSLQLSTDTFPLKMSQKLAKRAVTTLIKLDPATPSPLSPAASRRATAGRRSSKGPERPRPSTGWSLPRKAVTKKQREAEQKRTLKRNLDRLLGTMQASKEERKLQREISKLLEQRQKGETTATRKEKRRRAHFHDYDDGDSD
ncbi:hypothetical protein EV182_003652 [Spiromyces aspiralis]|uniref:Uncharacterized protein n=1 Tax=Spiromyces aspiralis TaxID=68401 RepID=A0ACC1HD42_9FUNG|nr:hypothetical protein EV182_003652 [Spiromyces aspiralis]